MPDETFSTDGKPSIRAMPAISAHRESFDAIYVDMFHHFREVVLEPGGALRLGSAQPAFNSTSRSLFGRARMSARNRVKSQASATPFGPSRFRPQQSSGNTARIWQTREVVGNASDIDVCVVNDAVLT